VEDPLQVSIFLCDLAPAERVIMEDALRRTVLVTVDSVVIVDLGPAGGLARDRISVLGQEPPPGPARYRVI
jgi:hypothetical protein